MEKLSVAIGSENEVSRMKSVRVPKAGTIVASQLRMRILRGELKEGDTLPQETELVQQFGVSRPTLREAFRMLEAEGLIRISRGTRGGAVVQRPDIKIAARYMSFILQFNGISLDDVYKTRVVIEPAAVRLVAENASETAPAVLRAQWQIIEDNISDDRKFGPAVADFHRKLVELSGVQTLYLLTEIVHKVLALYISSVALHAAMKVDTSESKRRGQRVRAKLIDLIEQGAADEAHDLWTQHMNIIEKMMRDWQPSKTVLDLSDMY